MAEHCYQTVINVPRREGGDSKPWQVVLWVDLEGLASQLGRKASRNKSRKAVEVGGLVRVKVTPAT
jgi:hypothetical protein